MHFSHKHPLLPHLGITQQHRASRGPIPRPAPHPPDAIRVVEVIVLLAVGVQFARQRQIGDLALRGGGFPVVFHAPADAVDVAVEEAGVAVFPQQDQGVGEGEEPVGYLELERLGGLRVMVLDLGGVG